MKLIDIVKDMPWPEGANYVVQDGDLEIVGFASSPELRKVGSVWSIPGIGRPVVGMTEFADKLADDWDTAIITREMWQAAQKPKKVYARMKCEVSPVDYLTAGKLYHVHFNDDNIPRIIADNKVETMIFFKECPHLLGGRWERLELTDEEYREQVEKMHVNGAVQVKADEVETAQVEAVQAWRGPEDGLPPVGTVCEVDTGFMGGEWVKCKVLCHALRDNQVDVIFQILHEDGEPAGWSQSHIAESFRPIRTKVDQIKSIERLIEHGIAGCLSAAGIAKSIIDAGWVYGGDK